MWKQTVDWVLASEASFVRYLLKSAIGLIISLAVTELLVPGYMNMPLLPSTMELTRNVYFSLVLAGFGLIVSGHITFQLYVALPFVLFKWWKKRKMAQKKVQELVASP